MIYYDAAICGYWSYEQDILVGFYDSFLTEFEITADLITEDSKYCRKYRNDDYNQTKYEDFWIMPQDAITPSASMIVAPASASAFALAKPTLPAPPVMTQCLPSMIPIIKFPFFG